MGAEVVARMVENISQDSRLLPPVQKAVQDLEPAIRKLIRHDPRFSATPTTRRAACSMS
jgi:hypothetical protein